jgi:(p)ppGpp synthase/HD superfamily hydrolase
MVHPLVSHILADMRMTSQHGHRPLHDVVRTLRHRRGRSKYFGEDVARCVDGVTKLSKPIFSAESGKPRA